MFIEISNKEDGQCLFRYTLEKTTFLECKGKQFGTY